MAVEKINLNISQSEIYLKWLKTFQKQDSGEGIIQLLENFTLKSSKEARDWLKLHVLITCFCAEKYNRKYDQGYQTRKKEKDRTNEIVKQIADFRIEINIGSSDFLS